MASLDMSLDDMIKSRRNTDRGARGQGSRGRRGGRGGPRGSFRGGRSTGAPRRDPLGVNTRQSAHTIAKSFRRTKNLPWQNGLFEDSLQSVGLSGYGNGTKLFVSNLDAGVTNEDIRELFSEIGELSRYAIHFNKNGRPGGSAEVLYSRRSDAIQALKRYNNVQLDGRPMKVELVTTNSEVPVSARVNVFGANGRMRRTVTMTPGSERMRGPVAVNRGGGGVGQRGRGTFRGGRGRGLGGRGRGLGVHGRGRGQRGGRGWRKKAVEKSSDDLDKELDAYHAGSMEF